MRDNIKDCKIVRIDNVNEYYRYYFKEYPTYISICWWEREYSYTNFWWLIIMKKDFDNRALYHELVHYNIQKILLLEPYKYIGLYIKIKELRNKIRRLCLNKELYFNLLNVEEKKFVNSLCGMDFIINKYYKEFLSDDEYVAYQVPFLLKFNDDWTVSFVYNIRDIKNRNLRDIIKLYQQIDKLIFKHIIF